jgi:polyisoprenoid-binding protein YceI
MSNFKIDPSHSEVSFKVKHLMISTVTGQFGAFDAEMAAEQADFSDAKINFNAEINSISTNNSQRDEHLKSADFFDAAAHPKLEFTSTAFRKTDDNNYQLEGNLSLHGIVKPIVFEVEYAGQMTDPYGNEKHGFEINGKINRKDYDLNWSAVTEAGGIVVSDEVKIAVNAQFVKI